jgi:hypothetical protein
MMDIKNTTMGPMAGKWTEKLKSNPTAEITKNQIIFKS